MEKVIEETINYFNSYFESNNEAIESNLVNQILHLVGGDEKNKLLVENTIKIIVKNDPKYYFTEELVNNSKDESGISYGGKYRRICKRK